MIKLALTILTVFNMANYKDLTPTVLKFEGGYAANIDGKTCTMKGVTLATYKAWYGKLKTCKDLKNITDEEWETIFKNGYWDKWHADQINNQAIANLLVDWVWTSGIYGIKYPQAILGVKPDGKVGPVTLAAINNHPDPKKLYEKLWLRRKKHFEDIARKDKSKAKFLKGWMNRLNDFKFE